MAATPIEKRQRSATRSSIESRVMTPPLTGLSLDLTCFRQTAKWLAGGRPAQVGRTIDARGTGRIPEPRYRYVPLIGYFVSIRGAAAPRTPLHALSRAALPARSVRVARSPCSLATPDRNLSPGYGVETQVSLKFLDP